MKKVAITTLGCKTNQFESAAMTEALQKDGFCIVPFTDPADIYIINSCSVTAKTDAESRRLIRKGMKQNPSARIVVTGCYAQLSAAEILDLGVHLVIGNSEKRDLVRILREADGEPRALVGDISEQQSEDGLALETFAEHTRAFLQVQNGCNASCAYCIVPKARGRSRSVAPERVLEGVAAFAAKGFREVVLSGIHLGAYGLDLSPATDLLALLKEIEKQGVIGRLRIGSVEPTEMTPELISFVTASPIVCQHLHIPLQSGSDAVLERMNRGYEKALFREVTESLAQSSPDICIGADVIAGFPGESDEEFEEGYTFLESLPLAYLHVFPFSSRPGTPAATMKPQVPAATIKERALRLRQLSDRKKESYYRSFLGRTVQVLIQKEQKGVRGLSRNYIPVQIEGVEPPQNSEVSVLVTRVQGDHLVGKVVTVSLHA
ncbi:tRNA (N(6)-L-threonylcarbamoyladenosine(37)-C(2))-methylthiotransferase MtaB [Geomonas sp. RF6]|uniref:tRNA (N(6)-L-threonylcarbamoyladenosine(37)-C(2))- methylthiotransferase MtaB n=1 Tax=Geomonas sp. RF6 TaxID=2897342 RepID=UPI001E34D2F5|nr:tRNA (N(6)-L-threonylcarbamoyladenosine(37)-C(2))-methylthiotransferase MtaB [Geomonas sp. RF6]UFS71290.1 tRNA (N(6)-L-threonylcarbamoyladenosine(37)-C(2))-methylthiotransferase MtaB [Geomonas sp. RF6]